ncbi:MAG: hypothetical protein ABH896_02450, partial [Candidatus Jacksonbacteria bacterium]
LDGEFSAAKRVNKGFHEKVFVSNYGRKLPPFPTLFLEAYTDDIKKYLGFKFSRLLTRYIDSYGDWYFIKSEWEKYGRRILKDLEAGNLKIVYLQRKLEQFAKTAIKYLLIVKKRLPYYDRGSLLKIFKKYCYLHRQVIALGDPAPYVSQEFSTAKLVCGAGYLLSRFL